MKIFKFSGIIVLAAVIGFLMAACPEPDELPDNTPTVTSVTVSPATQSVVKGGTQNFSATVTGENEPAQTVTWSIVQTNKNSGTTINSSGVLTVAAAETLATLTVRATSTVDTSKYGEATVTIHNDTGTLPSVTTVTVTPATATVAKGGNQNFSAQVTGTNSPAQTVTWSIDQANKHAQTTINNSGVLSVAAAENLSTLTLRATSTVDTTKSGMATVTVSSDGSETPVTSWKELTIPTQTKGILHQSYQGKNEVLHISPNTAYAWNVLSYPLTSHAGQEIEIEVSMQVWLPVASKIVWQVNTSSYPTIAGSYSNVTAGSWQTVSGKAKVTPASGNFLYLSGEQLGGASAYIADFTMAIDGVIDNTPTVSNVFVNPDSISVAKGGTQNFSANVEGNNNPAQTVTWSIDQNDKHTLTTINSSSGVLTVAAEETLTTLTVRATSTVDSFKSGTATVTVTETGGDDDFYVVITGVSVTPNNVQLIRGASQQYTAEVSGYWTDGSSNKMYPVPQTVTWSFGKLEGGYVTPNGTTTPQGSSINNSGLLSLSASETNETLSDFYIMAISTEDTNISGYAYAWIDHFALTGELLVYPHPYNAIAKDGVTWFIARIDNGQEPLPMNSYNWSIDEANKSAQTTINHDGHDGYLYVAPNETLTTITVRATLKTDPTVTGTGTIRVVTIDKVTISPSAIVVLPRGETHTFTAVVHGENNPPQDVNWNVYDGDRGQPLNPGTTIDNTGKLTIAAGERSRTLVVSAGAVLVPGSSVVGGSTGIYVYNPNAGGGYVVPIIFAPEETTTTITLQNLVENEVFLSKMNTTNALAYTSQSIQSPAMPSFNIRPAQRNYSQITNNAEKQYIVSGHPLATAFSANPPPIPAHLKAKRNTQLRLNNFVAPQTGAKRNFWVDVSGSNSYETKEATLLATGTHGNIWVVDSIINTTQAETMADKFDIIYPAVTNVFGYEFGGGPDGDGGRDGDPKVQILVQSIQGTAVGFFTPADFYDEETLGAMYGGSYKTNLAEIFYIDGDYYKSNPEFIFGTLAHELQHMIHFNEKFVKQDLTSSTWYDEMLAMMAEDLVTSLLEIDNANAIWYARMNSLFTGFQQNSLTAWRDSGASPNLPLSYAEKYAFGAYLLRNYGGAEIAKAIISNAQTDIASINAALQAVKDVTFDEAFSRYGEAFVYSDPTTPAEINTFDRAVESELNGTTYNIRAFDIWRQFGDIETYFYYNSSSMQPYSVAIEVPSIWRGQELTGNLSVTITKPEDGVVLFLMVK